VSFFFFFSPQKYNTEKKSSRILTITSRYDFFGSPQDPAFYIHHSMIDKVWTDWQAVDPVSRRYVYFGTSTIFNGNATANVVNDTVIDFGRLGSTTVGEVQDPQAGPYCYQYV
jgi:tyrosinase